MTCESVTNHWSSGSWSQVWKQSTEQLWMIGCKV